MTSLADRSILDRLRAHSQSWPDKPVYQFLHDNRTDTYTFGDLERRVRSLAARLRERAAPGDRALLLYHPGLEFIESFLACLAAGIIAVPAAPPRRNRSTDRVHAMLRDARPRLALSTRQALDALEASGLGEGLTWLATDSEGVATDSPPLPDLEPESTAFLQYTSGSTASPRGVVITHANICATERQIEQVLRPNDWGSPAGPSVGVSWLPMFHDMGLIAGVLQPLHTGFQVVLLPPTTFLREPVRWLRAISEHRAAISGGPNFAFDLCVRNISEEQKRTLDLSCWQVAFNGAEPIRSATFNRFAAEFKACGFCPSAFTPCYGLAEATVLVSVSPPGRGPIGVVVSKPDLEAGRVRPASSNGAATRSLIGSGRVAGGTDVVIVDADTGKPCPPEVVGEVWLRSACVGKGYWDRAEETARIFQAHLAGSGEGPFLRTGDLGFLFEGELFITGRLKDLIIIRGRNLHPQDIEETVEQAVGDDGTGCTAFAVESAGGEQLVVVVELHRETLRTIRASGNPDTEFAKLISLIREAVTRTFDVGTHTVVIVRAGCIPRTSSGKVQRGACRRQWLAEELDIAYLWQVSAPVHEETPASRHVANVPHIPACPERTAATADDTQTSKTTADRMIGWFRTYTESRFNPRLADERRMLPPAVVLELGNQGFFGLQVPRDLGGCGLRAGDARRVLEQLAAVDLTLAVMVGSHNGLGLPPILRHTSPEDRDRLIPALAAGRQLAAFALTEPMAGSNPSALQTVATPEDGGWRLSGEKRWIGMGSWASWLTVLARAVDASGKPLGLTAFLVDATAPGFRLGPESLTMGMRAMVQNRLYLDGVWVPANRVLGGVGAGIQVTQEAINLSRLGVAVFSLGVMKRAAQLWLRYAGRRTVATGRLLDSPVTLGRLCDLTAAIAAVEALVKRMVQQLDAAADNPAELYVACKATAPELAFQAVDLLLQALGGRGYEETSGVPRLFRDARLLRIFEGPTETMLLALGAAGLQKEGTARRLLADPFGDGALTGEVAGVLHELRHQQALGGSFPDQVERGQMLCFKVGEMLASAVLLAAARSRGSEQATEWAEQRYAVAFQAIRRPHRPLAGPALKQLTQVVAGYTAAIGDVEPTLAGEETDLDSLLRRDAPAPDAAAPAGAQNNGSMVRLVHDIVLARLQEQGIVAGDTPLDHNTPFTALGLDSLLLMRIGLDVQNATGVVLSPELVYEFASINELARYLERGGAREPHQPEA